MKIPDGWNDYSNMGRRITGTRFICFKVPLDRKDSSFDLRSLTDHIPDLGIVVDLTNTKKYYKPQPLSELNIEYQKIFTEGHVIPKEKVVRQFFDAVNEFLDKNMDNSKLIGVHCTHGLNRTGYMVCRYMIQLLDFSPDQAITDFNSARGHEIERVNYLDDLRTALWKDEDYLTYEKDGEENKSKKRSLDQEEGGKFINSWENENYESPYQRSRKTIKWEDETTPNRSRRRSSSIRSTGYSSQDEAVTPRGRKRSRDDGSCFEVSISEASQEEESDGEEDIFKRKTKYRKAMETYDNFDTRNNLYDPYFYQKRAGGGPDRDRKTKDVKKYRGPNRRYKSPPREEEPREKEDLGFDDVQPLSIKDRKSLETKFIETPDAGKSEPRSALFSPGSDEPILSPEISASKNRKKNRSSARFEPY